MNCNNCAKCDVFTCDLITNKCRSCYNEERNLYYHLKKIGNQDLIYINSAYNTLKYVKNKPQEVKIAIMHLKDVLSKYIDL